MFLWEVKHAEIIFLFKIIIKFLLPKSVLALTLSVTLMDVKSYAENIFELKLCEALFHFVSKLLKLSLHLVLRTFIDFADEVSEVSLMLLSSLLVLIAYLARQICVLEKFE